MKKKKIKYLHQLAGIILLGLLLPVVLFFIFFQGYAVDKMERLDEDFYEKALETYTSLLDKKMQELEVFAARISAESREYDSVLLGGAEGLDENSYQIYAAVNDLKKKYNRSDVSEWGIFFYDIDKIITSQYAYTLEHFLYKYTGQSMEEAECADFFSEENYSILNTFFDTTNTDGKDNGYLLAGVCTRIGMNHDRALIFCLMSPQDISDSLMIVGGEGITYYLMDQERDKVLLMWGDDPGENAAGISMLDEWQNTSGVKQKVLHILGSSYPQLSVSAYISQDSLQSSLIDWALGMRRLLVGTVIALLLISCIAIGISYKPVYELIREFDYTGGNEFEMIRHTLGSRESRIVEQEMLILDLLINHLIYGIPISEERIIQLGVGETAHYYCVFLVEGCFFASSEVEKLTGELEKNGEMRIFVTDWHEENSSVVIAFLKEEDISALQERMKGWLRENYGGECSLYTGKVVDSTENIQASFRSCLRQITKKNGRKSKPDTGTLNPKEEQQKKMKAEILAYLEVHYRDSDLSQVQVADLFRISNYTLSRLFKNHVGVGFAEYLTAKRLEYAKELLLTTSYSVKEVAAMAGFSGENYFSRTFKLYEGASPSSFRKK